jgi:hypothetical protein
MPQAASRVFISYSHDSAEHLNAVLALADRLRQQGVDCWIDQYEWFPSEGWPQWCENQIEEARYVLVVCTKTYLRRFKKKEDLDKGKGVTFEGHIITLELYNAQGKNKKFIPVVFAARDRKFIPTSLQGAPNFDVSKPDGYRKLCSGIRGESKGAPPLGTGGNHPSTSARSRALRKLKPRRDFALAEMVDSTLPRHEKQIRTLHHLKPMLEKKVWIEYQCKILDRWLDSGSNE